MSIWGKLIGGATGFALGGPIGAILGVAAGHGVDKVSKNDNFKISDEINKLNDLRIKGILTEEEYKSAKKKLLG